MSTITKKARTGSIVFGLLSFLCFIGPIIATFIIALYDKAIETSEKTTLGVIFIFVVFVSVVNLIAKWHLRTPIWIMLFALYFITSNFIVELLIIGICTILDELIFTPLHKHYKNKFKINKEIDNQFEMRERQAYGTQRTTTKQD